MSDANRKSIMDFVSRQQQQFAERRKQQQQQQQGSSTSSSSTAVTTTTTASSQQQDNAASLAAISSSLASSAAARAPPTQQERAQIVQTWAGKVQDFVNDPTQTRLEMPSLLSGYDRRELHNLAAKFNLSHSSTGSGTQRRLVLSKDALFYRGSAAGITTGPGALQDPSAVAGFMTDSTLSATTTEAATSSSATSAGVSAAIAGTGSRTMSRREKMELRANQDERELYADKSAIKGFRRFQDAMNPHARAVEAADGAEFEVPVSGGGERYGDDEGEEQQREARRRPRPNDGEGNNNNNDGSNNAEEDESGAAPVAAGERMTASQVIEAARVNELAEEHVTGWLERFAANCEAKDDPKGTAGGTERVVFCIDPADFVTACGPLSRARAGGSKIVVAELQEQQQEDGASKFGEHVSQICSAAGPSSDDNVCLCLPGMPLFGEPLKIALAFPAAEVPAGVQSAVQEAGGTVETQ